MAQKPSLSYSSEADRCYGAAGMAISLTVMDGEELLQGVDIDAPPHEMIMLDASAFFSGNPALSARAVWQQTLRNFNFMASMAIGNVMCRTMVGGHDQQAPSAALRDALRDAVGCSGADACALEADEADRLFQKDYEFLHRVFAHRGVQEIARRLADTLARERSLGRADTLYHLRGLSML